MDFIFSLFSYNQLDPARFNSVFFFMLIFAVVAVLTFSDNRKFHIYTLLGASLLFYYKLSGLAIIVLIYLAVVDFYLAKAIQNTEHEKQKYRILLISIFNSLVVLGYFKYANFFLSNYFAVVEPESIYIPLNILFPVGISFYVFRGLSYTIDVAREVIEPENNFGHYLLYLSFFPSVLAGPISKARDFLPQLSKPYALAEATYSDSLYLIMRGAIKKFAISDFIAVNFVTRVFDSPTMFSGFEVLVALYGATLLIYADFSGYTDMAVGLAGLLGFKVKHNFNQPFLAENVTDFWRRWHITLTEWFNDYVYKGLNFKFRKLGLTGVIAAVFITFTISGIWHGPNWTFIIWGVLHGIAIAYDRLTLGLRDWLILKLGKNTYLIFARVITFHFIALSIILFQSNTLTSALILYEKLFTAVDFSLFPSWWATYSTVGVMMVLGYAIHFIPNTVTPRIMESFAKLSWIIKALIFALLVVLLYQVTSSEAQPFIYLEF